MHCSMKFSHLWHNTWEHATIYIRPSLPKIYMYNQFMGMIIGGKPHAHDNQDREMNIWGAAQIYWLQWRDSAISAAEAISQILLPGGKAP